MRIVIFFKSLRNLCIHRIEIIWDHGQQFSIQPSCYSVQCADDSSSWNVEACLPKWLYLLLRNTLTQYKAAKTCASALSCYAKTLPDSGLTLADSP
jgi:hypothetical protein